jgi:import inner membrane translocase subunit TIM21
VVTIRTFAEDAASDNKSKTKAPPGSEGDEDMTKEIVLTPGEKVVAATRLTMWAGIAVFASVCAYYIGKELFPTYVPCS